MEATILENQLITVQPFRELDTPDLLHYLQELSPETKSRFGPHEFNAGAVISFYEDHNNKAYVVKDSNGQIIAYTILRIGYVQSDYNRYQSCSIILHKEFDCTIAPSVADEWQSKKLGSFSMDYILKQLKGTQLKRMILWGGVQADNTRAVNFYKKYGFQWIADFNHNGINHDMMLTIHG